MVINGRSFFIKQEAFRVNEDIARTIEFTACKIDQNYWLSYMIASMFLKKLLPFAAAVYQYNNSVTKMSSDLTEWLQLLLSDVVRNMVRFSYTYLHTCIVFLSRIVLIIDILNSCRVM